MRSPVVLAARAVPVVRVGGGGASKTASDPADTNGDGTVSAAEQAAYDAKMASSSNNSDAEKLVKDFLKLIEDSAGSTSSYGTDGDSLKAQIQSLIVNYQA